MIQKYIAVAYSNNEHYNADCDYALISLTPELLRKLVPIRRAFLEQKQICEDLNEWHVTDYSATFISRKAGVALLGEDAVNGIDDSVDPFPAPFRLPQTEGDLEFDVTISEDVVITAAGFWWHAFPDRAGITVENICIPWEWFTQCTHCNAPREEHVDGKCLFASTTYAPLSSEFDCALSDTR
jgi:hypothetical protein